MARRQTNEGTPYPPSRVPSCSSREGQIRLSGPIPSIQKPSVWPEQYVLSVNISDLRYYMPKDHK